jgi:uncharacterized membrane protein YvlD (DUF360 family)
MLIKLAVMFALFCALLYVLNKIMPDFQMRAGAIPLVSLLLVGVNVVVGWFLNSSAAVVNFLTLGVVKAIVNFLTLGLFSLLVSYIFNLIIFYLVDRLSENLTIKSTKTLLVSAAALQFSNYVLGKVF